MCVCFVDLFFFFFLNFLKNKDLFCINKSFTKHTLTHTQRVLDIYCRKYKSVYSKNWNTIAIQCFRITIITKHFHMITLLPTSNHFSSLLAILRLLLIISFFFPHNKTSYYYRGFCQNVLEHVWPPIQDFFLFTCYPFPYAQICVWLEFNYHRS